MPTYHHLDSLLSGLSSVRIAYISSDQHSCHLADASGCDAYIDCKPIIEFFTATSPQAQSSQNGPPSGPPPPSNAPPPTSTTPSPPPAPTLNSQIASNVDIEAQRLTLKYMADTIWYSTDSYHIIWRNMPMHTAFFTHQVIGGRRGCYEEYYCNSRSDIGDLCCNPRFPSRHYCSNNWPVRHDNWLSSGAKEFRTPPLLTNRQQTKPNPPP